jgi:hypothetical protein
VGAQTEVVGSGRLDLALVDATLEVVVELKAEHHLNVALDEPARSINSARAKVRTRRGGASPKWRSHDDHTGVSTTAIIRHDRARRAVSAIGGAGRGRHGGCPVSIQGLSIGSRSIASARSSVIPSRYPVSALPMPAARSWATARRRNRSARLKAASDCSPSSTASAQRSPRPPQANLELELAAGSEILTRVGFGSLESRPLDYFWATRTFDPPPRIGRRSGDDDPRHGHNRHRSRMRARAA